jgi:hypothetical protein
VELSNASQCVKFDTLHPLCFAGDFAFRSEKHEKALEGISKVMLTRIRENFAIGANMGHDLPRSPAGPSGTASDVLGVGVSSHTVEAIASGGLVVASGLRSTTGGRRPLQDRLSW